MTWSVAGAAIGCLGYERWHPRVAGAVLTTSGPYTRLNDMQRLYNIVLCCNEGNPVRCRLGLKTVVGSPLCAADDRHAIRLQSSHVQQVFFNYSHLLPEPGRRTMTSSAIKESIPVQTSRSINSSLIRVYTFATRRMGVIHRRSFQLPCGCRSQKRSTGTGNFQGPEVTLRSIIA